MRKTRDWNPAINRFEQAAVAVLRKARRPLTVKEIVERMVELGLVEPSGKTPQNSMQNTIRRANIRRKKNGEPPIFVGEREGAKLVYSLNEG